MRDYLDNNQLLYGILVILIVGDETITKTRVNNAMKKAETILEFIQEQNEQPTT